MTAISMDKEIATSHTVTLIEDKLPRRVLIKWLEIPKDEMPKTGYEKFMKLVSHLKLERKRDLSPRKRKDQRRIRIRKMIGPTTGKVSMRWHTLIQLRRKQGMHA